MQPMSSMQTTLLPGVTPGWNDPPPIGNPSSGSRLNRYRRVVDPSLTAAGGSPTPYAASPQPGMPMGAPHGMPMQPMQQPVLQMQQPQQYVQQPMQHMQYVPPQQYAQPDYSMPPPPPPSAPSCAPPHQLLKDDKDDSATTSPPPLVAAAAAGGAPSAPSSLSGTLDPKHSINPPKAKDQDSVGISSEDGPIGSGEDSRDRDEKRRAKEEAVNDCDAVAAPPSETLAVCSDGQGVFGKEGGAALAAAAAGGYKAPAAGGIGSQDEKLQMTTGGETKRIDYLSLFIAGYREVRVEDGKYPAIYLQFGKGLKCPFSLCKKPNESETWEALRKHLERGNKHSEFRCPGLENVFVYCSYCKSEVACTGYGHTSDQCVLHLLIRWKTLSGQRWEQKNVEQNGQVVAPADGVIQDVLVKQGDIVKMDQIILVMTSLEEEYIGVSKKTSDTIKMEYIIRASRDSIVDDVNCSPTQNVIGGAALLMLKMTD